MKQGYRERRRHPRTGKMNIDAAITSREQSEACPVEVESLSIGGALVTGPLRASVGERLRVTLGSRALDARVLRIEGRGGGSSAVALAFCDDSPAALAEVERIVLRALARERGITSALVLDDEPGVRSALGRDLRDLGFTPRLVAAPLDLLRCLDDPALDMAVALVDLCLCQEDGTNVLTFLSEDHPRIRRTVMSGARFDDLERCVSSGQAHTLLRKPWSRSDLVRALGLAR
jgi:CheY-like chemotaxis protein